MKTTDVEPVVFILTKYCMPEVIEKFFTESGIAFHRADPFIKPTKTAWQLLKEKVNR